MNKLNLAGLSLVIAGLSLTFAGCGTPGNESTQGPTAQSTTVKQAAPAATQEASMVEETKPVEETAAADVNPYAEGEKIYNAKCIVCHQATGEGIPGAFPPLKNSDYLLSDKVRAVAQVLNGSNHEITVNGSKYSAPMPQQVNTHEEAVAVINYVLNAWGNNGGTVTLEEVKDVKIDPRI